MNASLTAGVIWDLDDTLLNTLPARVRGLEYAYEKCVGGKVDALALWRSHRGGTLEALAERIAGPEWRRFVALCREVAYSDQHPIQIYDGVQPVLAACAEHGRPMAVVTQKISWAATDLLARAGLLQYFGAVIGVDDTDNPKPDPDPIYAALERLAIYDSAGVVAIGDSPADVLAARNGGCTAVAALWGSLDEELVLDARPDHVARHPMDLLPVLGFRLEVA
jgi:pyrophosphatase PpaX